jgi:AcrR family transcriptional regulator
VTYDWPVPTEANAGRGRLADPTGDARSDRWREHRAAVRADLVEATLRAIDEYGPDLSIDDVVRAAGIPRPKIYRFFDDKDALFGAVSERVQQMIIERVVPHFDLTDTPLGLVRSTLTAYVGLVAERPNVFRFLVSSHFGDGGRSTMDLVDDGRSLSDATAAVLTSIVTSRGGNGENLEYFVDATLGAVALGVLRWLNTPAISEQALVEQLTTFVWGAISATAAARGVVLDPDEHLTSPES